MFSVSCTFRLPCSQMIEHVGQHARAVAMSDDEHVRGRRASGQVDHVRHAPRLLVGLDDADGLGGDGLLRLIGGGADVVRAVDARQADERVAERPGAGRLLA